MTKNLKELLQLIKGLENIATTLKYFKELLTSLVETTNKNSTDTQLIKDNINDLKSNVEKICGLITNIEKSINMLNVQLDYKERKEYKKEFNTKKFFDFFILMFKNSRWVFYIVLLIVIIIAIILNNEKILNIIFNILGIK